MSPRPDTLAAAIAILLGALFAAPAAAQRDEGIEELRRFYAREQGARIADLEPLHGGSPRPYAPRPNAARPAWHLTLHRSGASYLRVYLRMDLGPGDELVVRDAARAIRWRYARKGPVTEQLLGNAASSFPGFGHAFATDTVFGDRLHLELFARTGGGGVEILQLERGYPWARLQLGTPPENPCVQTPPFPDTSCEPSATRRARARAVFGVANGGVFCTGFLVSSRSHFLTANHCLPSASIAATANLWFGYETDCGGSTLRGTTVVPAPQTFLGGDATHDWSLLRASSNPAAQFGWLSLEPIDPGAGETLYVPSHPGGRPQELTSGPARGVLGFPGSTHFQHRCDTEAGSSGAPVLREGSHCVVGLHTHGACILNDPHSANWAARMSVLAPILMRIDPSLAVCGTSGAGSTGCEPAEVLPSNATGEGSSSLDLPFQRSGAQRVQVAYGGGAVDHPYALRVRGLRWRLDGGGLASYGASSWDLALELSTARSSPDALDRAFDRNHGNDRTSVFDGVLAVPGVTGGSSPNAFDLALEFERVFEWDPRSGPLLLDFRVRSGTAIGRALDADAAPFALSGCIAAAGSANAAAATFPASGVHLFAPVMELCVELHHAPSALALAEAPLSSALPWSGLGPNGARVLTAYEGSAFAMPGLRRITRLAWRPDQGAALPAAAVDVRVSMSTAPAGRASALVPSFAANHGPDRRVVFDGTARVAARRSSAPRAAAAGLQIELATPFFYDPARGALIVDLEIRSANALQGLLWDASAAVNGSHGRIVHSSDGGASMAQFGDALGCQLAVGAEPVVDLPLALAGIEGAGVSFDGLASPGASRELTVYDGAALGTLEPVFIQSLAWRPDGLAAADFGPAAWDLSIELSTCPHALLNAPSIFDQVHGADRRNVFDGIASVTYLDPPQATPARFEVAVALHSPFRWDPAVGGLVVDLHVRGRSGAVTRGLDATAANAIGLIRLVHPTDPQAAAAAIGPESRGPALRLWSTPARGIAVPYGSSCGPASICTTRGAPMLPAPDFAFRLLRSRASHPVGLLLGLSAMNLRLDFLGATGCTWLQSADLAQQGTLADAQGAALILAPLPPDPTLDGAAFYAQWAIADPQANAAGFALTAGLEITLGR